jgi:hypothetical protein
MFVHHFSAISRGVTASDLRDLLEAVNARYSRLRFRVTGVASKNPQLASFQFLQLGEVLEQLRKSVP